MQPPRPRTSPSAVSVTKEATPAALGRAADLLGGPGADQQLGLRPGSPGPGAGRRPHRNDRDVAGALGQHLDGIGTDEGLAVRHQPRRKHVVALGGDGRGVVAEHERHGAAAADLDADRGQRLVRRVGPGVVDEIHDQRRPGGIASIQSRLAEPRMTAVAASAAPAARTRAAARRARIRARPRRPRTPDRGGSPGRSAPAAEERRPEPPRRRRMLGGDRPEPDEERGDGAFRAAGGAVLDLERDAEPLGRQDRGEDRLGPGLDGDAARHRRHQFGAGPAFAGDQQRVRPPSPRPAAAPPPRGPGRGRGGRPSAPSPGRGRGRWWRSSAPSSRRCPSRGSRCRTSPRSSRAPPAAPGGRVRRTPSRPRGGG